MDITKKKTLQLCLTCVLNRRTQSFYGILYTNPCSRTDFVPDADHKKGDA